MSERIQYGFKYGNRGPRLGITIPRPLIAELLASPTGFRAALHEAKRKRGIGAPNSRPEFANTMLINSQMLGVHTPAERSAGVGAIIYMVRKINEAARPEQHDPLLRVDFPSDGLGAGGCAVSATVELPKEMSYFHAQIATGLMQQMAEDLSLNAANDFRAGLDKDDGLTLTLGSRDRVAKTIATAGTQATVEAYNLNNPAQQFVALAGLVAVSHRAALLPSEL